MSTLLKRRVVSRLKELGLEPIPAATSAGLERNFINDIINGKKKTVRGDMIGRLAKALQCQPEYLLLENYQIKRPYSNTSFNEDSAEFEHIGASPDLPEIETTQAYVSIEILPTFAGMGGKGTGDGDLHTALISRRLGEEELRAKPSDLLLINLRGTSMEPLFFHGDQILIDRRDRSPTQPGPFALLFDDGYAVKHVSWVDKRSKFRISSSNTEFPAEEFLPEEITILGRPVWFARRL